jgi:hypothetical protein
MTTGWSGPAAHPTPPSRCECTHLRIAHPAANAGRCRDCDCPAFAAWGSARAAAAAALMDARRTGNA